MIDITSKDFLLNTCKEKILCEALDPVDNSKVKEKNGLQSGAQSFVRPLIDMFTIFNDQ